MKTSTNEIRCDGCGEVIQQVLSGSPALYLTIKGQSVGHKKADVHNRECLVVWAHKWATEEFMKERGL